MSKKPRIFATSSILREFVPQTRKIITKTRENSLKTHFLWWKSFRFESSSSNFFISTSLPHQHSSKNETFQPATSKRPAGVKNSNLSFLCWIESGKIRARRRLFALSMRFECFFLSRGAVKNLRAASSY